MTDAREQPVRIRIPTRVDFAGGWSDVHYFSAKEGGAVLNAAIDRCVEGSTRWDQGRLSMTTDLDLPCDSHLGTSSAADVAWLALTNALMGREQPPIELAEAGYRLEKALGVEGGKQDQYAAAFGGILFLRFGEEQQPALVERLAVPSATAQELERRLVLCYSGRGSGATHNSVWERYRRGDQEVAATLRQIRDSAIAAREALLTEDFEALATQMTFNREAARHLHPSVVTQQMDQFFRTGTDAGALGAKPCGAGGGGCLLFLCAEGRRESVEQALRDKGGTLIDFHLYLDASVLA